MNKSLLKTIPLSAFNEQGWLKPTFWVYVNLIILSRGLLIFIMSLASIGQGDAILQAFFASKDSLYVSIAMSVVPLITIATLIVGEINEHIAIKRVLLALCCVQIFIEFVLLFSSIYHARNLFDTYLLHTVIAYTFVVLFTLASKRTSAFTKQVINLKPLLGAENETKA